MRHIIRVTGWSVALAAILTSHAVVAGRTVDEPETVMITLHVKPGSEDALARVIANHWDTARRLNLVREDEPHMTLRATEGDKSYFVEIFTWRDASIPDAAPPAILAIWQEMNALVETRDGRPALAIAQMTVVASR